MSYTLLQRINNFTVHSKLSNSQSIKYMPPIWPKAVIRFCTSAWKSLQAVLTSTCIQRNTKYTFCTKKTFCPVYRRKLKRNYWEAMRREAFTRKRCCRAHPIRWTVSMSRTTNRKAKPNRQRNTWCERIQSRRNWKSFSEMRPRLRCRMKRM